MIVRRNNLMVVPFLMLSFNCLESSNSGYIDSLFEEYYDKFIILKEVAVYG